MMIFSITQHIFTTEIVLLWLDINPIERKCAVLHLATMQSHTEVVGCYSTVGRTIVFYYDIHNYNLFY